MKVKNITRNGFSFSFINQKEFEILWRDIFEKEEYKIDLKTNSPLIIDVGAHIGLTTIYFKSQCPQAKIIAFEPNPQTAKILRLNLKANHLKGVTVIEAALDNHQGKGKFYIDKISKTPWSWGDSLIKNIWSSKNSPQPILIKTVILSKFLTKSIDLLKIDAEGAEGRIIKETRSKLHLVKNILIEYHKTPRTNPQNKLSLITKDLHQAGFKVKVLKQNKETIIKGVYEG
jgi:FkbM family methyltransferase